MMFQTLCICDDSCAGLEIIITAVTPHRELDLSVYLSNKEQFAEPSRNNAGAGQHRKLKLSELEDMDPSLTMQSSIVLGIA